MPAPVSAPAISEDDENHLREILDIFGEYSAKQLERMTQNEKPWLVARGNLPPEVRSSTVIDKSLMKTFYSDLYHRAENEQEQAA